MSGAAPAPMTARSSDTRVAEAFVDALRARDFATMTTVLAPNVRFRALVPSGLREAGSAIDAAAWFDTWFGAAERFEIVDASVEDFAGRQRISYRLGVVRNGGPEVLDQEGFCDVAGGRITDLSLVCSGFRPSAAP
jgi:SnoaL-like domain